MKLAIRVPIRTTNPNNGQIGNSRLAAILRAKDRKAKRQAVFVMLRAHDARPFVDGCEVVVRRVAPSQGLDPHDGLGAALKPVFDAIADWLGYRSDRDPRVRWVPEQRRGARGEYAVEIEIEQRAVTTTQGARA